MKIKLIYIVLPIFNEEKGLERLIIDIENVLKKLSMNFKIICVDDGSTDQSGKILKNLKKKNNLVIINHPYNLGLGYAIKSAFLYIYKQKIKNSIIIRLDSDNTHSPIYIKDFIKKIDEGFDVVIASRFIKEGEHGELNNIRKFISISANKVLKVFLNLKNIREITCGYRAYKFSIIEKYITYWGNDFLQLANFGFSSTVEKLVKLNLMKAKITEIPFTLRYEKKMDESKMIFSLTSLGYLTMFILLYFPIKGWKSIVRKNDTRKRHPIKK